MEIEEIAKKELAIKHNIPINCLVYVGSVECPWHKKDSQLVYFNIMLPGHKQYKSTITHQYNW